MVEAWERVFQKTEGKNLFMRQVWFDAWSVYYNSSGVSSEVTYEHVTVDNEHDAIIPYVYEKKGPLYLASLAGFYVPHRGIPNTGPNKNLIDKVADKMLAKRDVDGFRLGFVKENDAFILALVEELKRRRWHSIILPYKHDYGIDVPASEEEYLNTLSRNTRKSISRKRRRFEEVGHVETKYYVNEDPQVWKKVFKEIEQIELVSWVGHRGEPRFRGESRQKFWNDLVTDKWFSSAINAIIVYLDGEPVCHCISIDAGDTRYAYDTNYNQKVSKFGVGIQLEVDNMKQCIKVGLKYMNNSFGYEEFKTQWGRQKSAKHISYILFPATMKGTSIYLFVKFKHFVDDIYMKSGLRNLKRKLLS